VSPSPTIPPFSAITRALAIIRKRVDVPVFLPKPLPEGAHLAPGDSSFSIQQRDQGGITGQIRLAFGDGGQLVIEYGAPLLAECEAEFQSLTAVRVGPYPAVRGVAHDHVALLWPATLHELQGKYKLDGTLDASTMLRLARSMVRSKDLRPEVAPPAC
jgi:hypothetical protein